MRGAGIHCFRDLAAAGPPPKGAFLGDVFTPGNQYKIDLQIESAKYGFRCPGRVRHRCPKTYVFKFWPGSPAV